MALPSEDLSPMVDPLLTSSKAIQVAITKLHPTIASIQILLSMCDYEHPRVL